MSKLIIPAAELIGTPLTQEELKGIIAGRDSQVCVCTITYANGESDSPKTLYGATTPTLCAAACASWCSEKKAKHFHWTFSADGGGSI